jgi:predicted phage tail protein
MLTTVILDGAMGKKFGRRWKLAVNTPTEALRLIDANKPGVFFWIRDNLPTYEAYKVTCEYEDGSKEELDETTYDMRRKVKSIRFTPVVMGAGGNGMSIGKIILGIAMIVVAIFFPPAGMSGMSLFLLGASGALMAMGGVVEMLTKPPKQDGTTMSERKDKTSYYFDGPTNTSMQGVPVALNYGRILVGSHPISVNQTIDEVVA